MKTFLKFFLIGALVLGFTPAINEAKGQVITRKAVPDSVVNGVTKYITWASTPDGIQGIQFTGVKSSGTVSAVVTLETRIDTVNSSTWVPYKRNNGTTADTLSFGDNATNTGIFVIDNQYGNGFRIKVVSTGTQKFYTYSAYVRRGRR